VGLECNR